MNPQTATKLPDAVRRCTIDWSDGLAPWSGFASPAKVPAYLALASARTDMHRFVLGGPAPTTQADASNLHSEAVALSYMAQGFRAARWAGEATPRLSDDLFNLRSYGPTSYEAPHTATLVGLLCAGSALKLTEEEHADLKARFKSMSTLAHSAPSVSPAHEAQLAQDGYSASELVANMLARYVLHLSNLYRAALESPRPDQMLVLDPSEHDAKELLKHTCDAERLARDAIRVIRDGVTYGTGQAKTAD